MDVLGLTNLRKGSISAWAMLDLMHPETVAWINDARPDGPYRLSEIMAVDDYVADLKSNLLWAKFSSIHPFFTSPTAGVLDLKRKGGSFTNFAVPYDARKGFTCPATSTNGLSYTLLASALPEISQDSIMSIAYFNNTDATVIPPSGASQFMNTTGTINPLSGYLKQSATIGMSGTANAPGVAGPSPAVPYDINTKSFLMIRRSDSAGFVIQQHANNGTKVADAAITKTSVGIPGNGFRICGVPYVNMPERYALQTFGGALTDAEYTKFRELTLTFLTAFGAQKV